ncbi:5815_t:CDS:10 [Diversispora eburnea]|uniref:5815_t:CDS:1 n=1 Tax=Diversispora eburnea TaxID=1213867 RepID=A0A9N9FW97_9GLOM|nr:5815_t:CDS:10 [Diversispora eburnea]
MSSGKKVSFSAGTQVNEINGSGGIKTIQPLDIQQMQSNHAKTYPLGNSPHGFYSGMMNFFGVLCGTLGSIPSCCCFPNPYKSVDQGYVGLISRFGQFYKSVDPGLVKVNVFTEKLEKVDVMIQVMNIQTQTIMTKVINPYQATFGITNVQKALYDRVLIKDIQFTPGLQSSFSSAAMQKRIGESKVIAAQAEVDSAKFMKQAAELLNSPTAMQMRYLETMDTISKSPGAKVIFMPFGSSHDGIPGPSTNSASMLNLANGMKIKKIKAKNKKRKVRSEKGVERAKKVRNKGKGLKREGEGNRQNCPSPMPKSLKSPFLRVENMKRSE